MPAKLLRLSVFDRVAGGELAERGELFHSSHLLLQRVEGVSGFGQLVGAGAETDLVSIEDGEVKGWEHTKWGATFDVEVDNEPLN